MKKRLLTTLLALVMLVSSVPSAMAAKKNYEDEADGTNPNIYELWGDFENPASFDQVTMNTNGGCYTEWVKGGADGTKHSLKYDSTKGSTIREMSVRFPAVAGETYDISFYAKVENSDLASFYLLQVYDDAAWTWLPQLQISTMWTKVSLTWTCPSTDKNGDPTKGAGDLQWRFGTTGGGKPCVAYIDQLSIIPHGNVRANYDSVNEGFIAAEVEEEEEEVFTSADAVETTAVEFNDVEGHWAEATIETLASYDYVSGMGDGTYSPNTQVTRAQFIKMVTDIYNIIAPEYDDRFNDVTGDEWFTNSLTVADRLGIINNELKADGNIYPDKPITREEAATIAALVAKDRGAVVNENNATSFTDDGKISAWAKEGVKNAAAYGMIKGYDTGDYKPQASITRAEAAQILLRIVELQSRMLIYVDAQNGNDKSGDGTSTSPLKSIEAARDMAAEYASDMQNDIKILMRGKFRLKNTLKFNETHSGGNGYDIIYTSWGSEKPVITMADEYTDFQLYDEELNIYRTYVGKGTQTRQVYFNDVKGIRSRSVGYLKNSSYEEQLYWLCDNTELLDYEHPEELDLIFHINWCNPRIMVSSIEETKDGRVKISPVSSQYRYVAVRVDFALGRRCTSPSYIENALELVDERGEWYLSKTDGYLYYIPRAGEDMSTMVAKVPTGEWMIDATSSDYAKPWSNVTFENVCFEGTTWMRPTEVGGHADAQNNHIREGKDSAPGAAIHIEKCTNINFYNNVFRQMGVTGLEIFDGADHCEVIGNRFDNISGTAITVDDITPGATNARLSSRAKDSYVEYIKVNNNYITNTATDYKSAAAVSFAWPRHSEFNHNEIAYTSYSGFHGAYGWTSYNSTGTALFDVETNYNYIHDVFTDRVYDGGAWYTVGASSYECEKNNKELSNRCFGNYMTNSWTCAYIYPDEGTTSWYFKNNVVDDSLVGMHENNLESSAEKSGWFAHMHSAQILWLTFEDNYSTVDFAYQYGWMNARESNIEPLNFIEGGNYPDEAQAIVNNAGIEPEYRANFDDLEGAQFLACSDRRQSVQLNRAYDSRLMVLGSEFGKIYDISDYTIDLWCDDPEAMSIDENGYITCYKSGIWEAEAVVTIGGHTYLKHLKYEAGDEVESIGLNVSNVNLVEGGTGEYGLTAYTTFGNSMDITDKATFNLKVEDPSIVSYEVRTATTDASKTVIALSVVGPGETRLYGTVEYDGITLDVDIPVKTIKYSNDEAVNLPFRQISLQSGWKHPGVSVAGGGYKVTGSPNHFGGNVSNELIAFDMQVDAGSSWPSLVLLDSDRMGNYQSNDCYLVGFKTTIVELQRFNEGVRTMIFGDAGFSPIGGPGIPNEEGNKIVEYGKRYSVVVGAFEDNGATRIVLNINGKNIFDYRDVEANRIDPKSASYFAIYNSSANNGGFTFWPYSGITAETAE